MKWEKGRLGTGAWLAVLWAAMSGTTVAQTIVPPPYTLVIFVDAATGDDTHTGGINDPLKSINKALQKAYDFRFHPGDPLADPPEPAAVDNPNWHVVIRLVASTKPFGPVGGMAGPGNPGTEAAMQGWRSIEDVDSGQLREPFPLRMVRGVDIVGIKDRFGNKPQIRFEAGLGVFWTNWTFPPLPDPPAVPSGEQVEKFRAVIAATDDQSHTPTGVKIQNVRIDCSDLEDTNFANTFAGLYVANTTGIDIVDCDIVGCHDELWFAAARIPGEEPPDDQKHLEASIQGGTFNDAWPLSGDEGHAGMWIRGAGDLTVTVHDAEFSGSHDAIEIAGESVGDTSGTIGLDLIDSRILNNENGLEIVNSGGLFLTVSGSIFCGNYNRFADGGTLAPGEDPLHPEDGASTAAVALRGMVTRMDSFRDNTFVNNAYGILWGVPDAIAPLDLGTDATPGHNKFCMDFADPDASPYYRVMLFHSTEFVSTVHAAGNWWRELNQGATAQGFLTNQLPDVFVAGPQNMWNVNPQGMPLPMPQPPGPFWPDTFPRNFSISTTGGMLDLGNDPPVGDPPPCPVCPDPN